MSDPQGFSSYGTLMQLGDGADPEVFTTIAYVRDISGPEVDLGTEEITNHSGNGWRAFVGTVKGGGEVTFPLNFTSDDTHYALKDVYDSAVEANFRIVFPTDANDTDEFAALVTGLGKSAAVEGVLAWDVTLQVTGPVVSDHD